MAADEEGAKPSATNRILGSLRDALAAAGRDETGQPKSAAGAPPAQHEPTSSDEKTERVAPVKDLAGANDDDPKTMSAAEAARHARGGTPNIPPVAASGAPDDRHVEFDAPPTTRVVREEETVVSADDEPSTQMLRGNQKVKRGDYHEEPVVGWLVIVGGPGLGSYRPIFEGNNALGRSSSQRIPINFGDDAISGEEQCYIRYDSAARSFLFVPNLAKANVVSLNDTRPTGAVALSAMDVITVGRTQLVFVPFCGAEFDWSDLDQGKEQ